MRGSGEKSASAKMGERAEWRGLLLGELHPPLPVVFFLLSPLRRSHEIMANYTPGFSPEEGGAGVVTTQTPMGGTPSPPHFLFLSSRGGG